MRKIMLLCLIAALCSGCASTKSGGDGSMLQRYSGSRQLVQAEDMLREGNTAGATKVLETLVSGPSLPGVTDEALFRLALLTLKPGLERPASGQAQQHLKRLRKEHPNSPWTHLAAPLRELINVAEDLKHQNKNLKGTNQTLGKEINDLTERIEKLKHLDQELEKKSR